MKKKLEFLLTVELDERTQLMKSEEELRDSLKYLLASFVRQFTSGSIPQVKVTQFVRRPDGVLGLPSQ